jgi:O-antigen ligase
MPAAHPDRPVPAFVGLAVGLVLAAAPWPQRWSRTVVRAALSRRWLLPGPAVLVAAAVAVGLLASHSSVLSGNSVLSGKSVLSGNSVWSGRVGLSSPDRTGVAAAALQVWRDHLVTGVGPGRGLFIWTEPDHLRVFDRYAHDEYLQLAAEEGFVGLAGLVLAVGGTVVVVRRGLRHVASGRSRPSAARACCAGAAAGLLAFGAHSALDFLWHVPGVVLVAAVALGLASPRPTSGPGAGEQPVTTTTKELL